MKTLNRIDCLRQAYDSLYVAGHKHDSPERSRTNMIKNIVHWLRNDAMPNAVMLNLGAGPQMLERQLAALARNHRDTDLQNKFSTLRLISLDIARTPRLFAPDYAQHVRADSRHIPLRDGVVDLVVSNHSIDMLRAEPEQFERALCETKRVLKPGGKVLFNYHPASLYDYFTARYGKDDDAQGSYHRSDLPNPYYNGEEDIAKEMLGAGLQLDEVQFVDTRYGDKWWEVSAHKPNQLLDCL